MPRYFMRDTPLRAMERLMMSQPGHKPRGGGMYRSQFHYTPKDVECEYCQDYVRKNPCLLCECACLEERIEAYSATQTTRNTALQASRFLSHMTSTHTVWSCWRHWKLAMQSN